jgi:Ca2+-binding RTX toxin-like protein
MAAHVVGTINPDYALLGDNAPVANSDTGSVAYNQSVTIDVLHNDTDADTATQDQQFLGVGEYTDPVIAGTSTAAAGHLQVINNQFVFTADDPSFASGATDITFSYTAVDQWGAESNWTTVTVHVTGNSTPGITYCGTVHNDVIHDGGGNDHIYGNNGNDILYSSTGNDVMDGGNGKDQLFGGVGNDTLIGGNGNDTITAGSGNDLLIGGSVGDDHGNGHGCGPCGGGWGSGFDFDDIRGPSNDHDTFILPSNFSTVTIADFSRNDTIDISPWVFQSFSQVMDHATQQGCNVVISTADQFDPSTTHTLVLQHTFLWELHAKEFTFV